MSGTTYVGGAFGWFSPFALLCGVGLCLGYALMGSGWLTFKSEGTAQALAFELLPRLLAGVLVFLARAFVYALLADLPVMHRWTERPVMVVFPAIGVGACAIMAKAIAKRRELVPFVSAVMIFAAAMGTFAVSFYPYMIPFAITITDAAAPPSSQSFLFWGAGVFVLPLTLIYTLVIYFVFKGQVGAVR
jgi:cytochrome d ubiquinol oxidase subunit II